MDSEASTGTNVPESDFVDLLGAIRAGRSVADLANRIDAGQLIGFDQFNRLRRASQEQMDGASRRLAKYFAKCNEFPKDEEYFHQLDGLQVPPMDIWTLCGFSAADLALPIPPLFQGEPAADSTGEQSEIPTPHLPQSAPSNRAVSQSEPAAESRAEQPIPATSPRATELPVAPPAWIERARKIAGQYISEQRKRDRFPSQVHIGEHVATVLRNENMFGKGGRPLTATTIKRHALRGISSALGKAHSTTDHRGNQGK